MTLATTTNKATYDGDGTTSVFPVPFKFFDNAHVEAVLRDPNGAETVWNESTEYALTGAGNDAGGTLTAVTSPTDFTPQSGETLVIRRVIPLTQETDYPEGGAFPAGAHEDALDLAAMRDQQIQEENERSLRYPITDSPEISAEIPNSTTRANKYLAFDANGDPIAAVDPGSYPASAFGASLIDDADAGAALTTLGVSAFAKTILDDADAATARSTLGLLPYLGRNVLINGNFAVWQRGTSFTPGANAQAFTADRWFCNRNAVANYTVSRRGTSEQYSIRLQRNSGDTSAEHIRMRHVVESANCTPLIGKTVTLSFDARVGANFSPASNTLTVTVGTGTAVDEGSLTFATGWTGAVNASTDKTLTTAWARYSVQATLDANAREVGLLFSFIPTGTAGADDWLELRNIQLEAGDQATDFLHRPLGAEVALCQRYFAKTFPLATAPAEGAGLNGVLKGKAAAASNGEPFANWRYPVEMRAAPTVTLYNPRGPGTDGQWDDFAAASSANARVNTNGSGGCTLDNSGTQLGASSHFFIHAAADAEL
ncbi:MAG: hypothetical protein K8F57_07105 [Alphaproteobacteria bacterium]|nr:hypothetical protein [Alphaproteobacteria bacterium]